MTDPTHSFSPDEIRTWLFKAKVDGPTRDRVVANLQRFAVRHGLAARVPYCDIRSWIFSGLRGTADSFLASFPARSAPPKVLPLVETARM